MDIYSLTEFHDYMLFSFLVTCVESEEEEDEKSRKSEFSGGELRASRKSWGICITRY